jgi:hypothetical protein
MNLVTTLSSLSLASTVAFAAGLAFNVAALPLFGVAAAALTLLAWAGDYRTRPDYAGRTSVALRRNQALPLAA